MTNEDVEKALASLSENAKSTQDIIGTLKCGPTHSGVNLQLTGLQHVSAFIQDDKPHPTRKSEWTPMRTKKSMTWMTSKNHAAGKLVILAEAASSFLEASVSSKPQEGKD